MSYDPATSAKRENTQMELETILPTQGAVETWLVPLQGHGFDTEDLPLWLAGGDITALEHEGRVCLALRADAVGLDSENVLERAEQFLAVVNGAAFLLDPSHRPLSCSTSFYRIDSAGTKTSTVVSIGTAESRGKSGALGVSINGVSQPDSRHGAALPLLAAARTSDAAWDALVILGRPRPTWSELYVVYELAKGASGGKMIGQGWIDEGVAERFTGMANNRRALGIEARHGKDFDMPKKPMTHAEAVMAIRALVARWLGSPSA